MKKITLVLLSFLFTALLHAQVATAWMAQYNSTWGNRVDYGREIALDAAGNVYVAGHSLIDQQQHSVTAILKYSPAGQLIWNVESAVDEIMEDFKIDPQGNCYWTGYSWQGTGWDFLTVKLDSSGNVLWSVLYNGTGNYWDQAFSICLDNAGNVYICGSSKGALNGYDFVTIKYNNSGQQQWVARYASSASFFNDAHRVAVDAAGNVYTTGYTWNGSAHEMLLLKYDANGTQQWLQTLPVNTQESQVSINYVEVDPAGSIYVAGNVWNAASGNDVRLVRYNSAGTLLWQRTWSTPGNDSDYTGGVYYSDDLLALDNTGHIYLSGVTETPNTYFSQDIFTLRYDTAGNLDWVYQFDGAIGNEDRVFAMAVAGNGVYLTGVTATSPTIGGDDYITLKVDATTGLQQWQQIYNSPVNFYDEAHAITVDAMGGVYVTGLASQFQDPLDPRSDIVTIKYAPLTGIADASLNTLQLLAGPQPASGEVTLSFALEESADVSVTVFDETGRCVQTLDAGRLSPGAQQLRLDVSSLSPGIYLLRLSAGAEVCQHCAATTKLIITR